MGPTGGKRTDNYKIAELYDLDKRDEARLRIDLRDGDKN